MIDSGIEILIKRNKGPRAVKYVIMGECDVVIYFTSVEGYTDFSAIARLRNIYREFPGLRLYKKIGSDIFSFSNRTGCFRRIPKREKRCAKKEVRLLT